MTANTACRNCGSPLSLSLVDLGVQPVSNSYIPIADADSPEPKFPLHAKVCQTCWLVQVDTDVPAEKIFTGSYAYFSSFSKSWLAHCKAFAMSATRDLALEAGSLVIEIASNDGYLLQYFKQAGIEVLGIEPSGSVARVAEEKGIPTLVEFFGHSLARRLASEGRRPDLICSANVLAHVPDINDFLAGVAALLTDDAVWTVEFPHLLRMIEDCQFDTIYHEHYSYLSLVALESMLASHGLRLFRVEELSTHGGSLRLYVCLEGSGHAETPSVSHVREKEVRARLDRPEGYADFAARAERVRDDLKAFLEQAAQDGKSVAAYGAAAKGNTMLNYCAVDTRLIRYCVDRNPAKQNTVLPGSRIPVSDPARLEDERPDFVLILPWNLRSEVAEQLGHLNRLGTRFVVAVPELEVFDR